MPLNCFLIFVYNFIANTYLALDTFTSTMFWQVSNKCVSDEAKEEYFDINIGDRLRSSMAFLCLSMLVYEKWCDIFKRIVKKYLFCYRVPEKTQISMIVWRLGSDLLMQEITTVLLAHLLSTRNILYCNVMICVLLLHKGCQEGVLSVQVSACVWGP